MQPPDVTPCVRPKADRAVSVFCPAKINLTLSVAPPRADGLHPIQSIMIALAFGDELHLERLDGEESSFRISFGSNAPKPQPIDWPLGKDLAYRAHTLMQHEAGAALPVDCTLTKRIPTGAGLGGGSSDAAGMLAGLRNLFRLPVSDKRLVEMGLELGADVCFMVQAVLGHPAAQVTGIGEQIQPLALSQPLHLVLIFPEGSCPTGQVYASFDAMPPQPQAPQPSGLQGQKAVIDPLKIAPFNDLADAAARVCPTLKRLRTLLVDRGISTHVTGSGAALFTPCPSANDAHALAKQLSDLNIHCLATASRWP